MVLIRLSKRSSSPMGSIKTDLDKSELRGKRALLMLRKSHWRHWNVKVVVLDPKKYNILESLSRSDSTV
jgi:hypothetical protein